MDIFYRETSAIKVNNAASQIANNVGAAVESTNSLPASSKAPIVHYNRKNPKRRRLLEPVSVHSLVFTMTDVQKVDGNVRIQDMTAGEECEKQVDQVEKVSHDSDEVAGSLSRMVAVLCEQHLFLPLLRAFEIFLPSCSLLPFIRALQVCCTIDVKHTYLFEMKKHYSSIFTLLKILLASN